MWIFLYIFIALTTITVIPLPRIADIFWIPKEVIFVLGGFSLIGITLITNQTKSLVFKNKWLGLILIYTILSFGWYFYKPIIFNNGQGKLFWTLWTIRPTINLILGFWLIQTLVEYTDDLYRWIRLADFLCWLLLAFSVWAILQYFDIQPLFYQNVKWDTGTLSKSILSFGNCTLTGNFLAMLSPLCLMFKKLRYKLFYILSFIAIILSYSTISIAAFIIGLMAYLLLNKRWLSFLLTALISITVFWVIGHYNKSFLSFSHRFDIWQSALDLKQNIFWGLGLGNFGARGIKWGGGHALSAHNEFLQMISDNGIAFVVLVAGYLINLFRRAFTVKKSMLFIGYFSSFITYLIICLGSFPLRIAPLALVGILYIASLEAQIIKGE